MKYIQEQHAWPIGKAGFTMRIQPHVNLLDTVDVMQLVLKPNKLVKNVNAIIKKFTSFYKKQNHLPYIKTHRGVHYSSYLDDEP